MKWAAVILAMWGLTIGVAQAATHAIDVAQSKLTIYVYKSGLFSFAADNHEINAPIASGTLDEPLTSVSFVVPAAQMTVLDPQMPPDKRAQVQARMLSPDVLDPARYQTIEFKSTAITGSASAGWDVSGVLSLHGQSKSVKLHVTQSGSRFHGSTTLRQTDYGITPITIAGGTVKVKNDIRVDFDIVPGS
ncbi:MAG: YceI family protein [Candidatus Eremiobacteraeota bacterium]|nr:YceI family protein [Candidatus Eremiobacteraeota bacterium]MBV8366859.1 YceI family protein [Candidatus Eremiobacteraeota bacterium]